MATYEERLKQYEEVDEPTAKKRHIAEGIRKKFADRFDFGTLSDQEVIQRHYNRFGHDMDPAAYGTKLEEVYAKDYAPAPKPEMTLEDRAGIAGGVAAETGKALVPFVVPELGRAAALKAGAKAVATKIPIASQIGFLGGHAINAAVQSETAKALQATQESLPVPDLEAKTQEFYGRLKPGLTQRGYTDEQIMQEARSRAENISRGYEKTTESIQDQVAETQRDVVLEPAKAATDAFFMGIGAPQIEGLLQAGLARIGLTAAERAAAPGAAKIGAGVISGIAKHAKTGAIIGAPGMAIQEGADHAILAAAENKPVPEIAAELVKGAKSGALHGLAGGAILGGAVGTLQEGIGAVTRPLAAKRIAAEYRQSRAEAELDEARLRGWQEFNREQGKKAEVTVRSERYAEQDKKLAAMERTFEIEKTAANFNPHTSQVPLEGNPTDIALAVIKDSHGEDALLSEAGLRAASKIEERIRLFQDANSEVQAIGERALPSEGAPIEAPVLSPGMGLEMPAPGGRADLPGVPASRGAALAPEFAPRLEAPSVGPTQVAAPEVAPRATAAPLELPTETAQRVTPDLDFTPQEATVSVTPDDVINLERLGPPQGQKPIAGEAAKTLDRLVEKADKHQIPIVTRLAPVSGPRGGIIPLERVVPWYEKRGFKLVNSTKLPEGQMATATLRRDPVKPKVTMEEGQKQQMEKDIKTVKAPKPLEAAAPHKDLRSNKGFVYHATNLENALEISEGSMRPHGPSFGTEQAEWPDGSTKKRSYFNAEASSVHSFAPTEGKPVILRVPKMKGFHSEKGTGDMYTQRAIAAKHLQILTKDGKWMPLKVFAKKIKPAEPIVPKTPSLERLTEVLNKHDDLLGGEAQKAITSYVGHSPRAIESESHGIGIMIEGPLEDAFSAKPSEKGQIIRNEINKARPALLKDLKETYGSTVKLYRVQRPIESGTKPRNVLSWTSNPKFAEYYAGTKNYGQITPEQIEIAVKEMAEKGTTKVNRKRYKREDVQGFDMIVAGDYDYFVEPKKDESVIDGFRRYLEERAKELDDYAAEDVKNIKDLIITKDVPLKDIVWATDRAGQHEFIVRNKGK